MINRSKKFFRSSRVFAPSRILAFSLLSLSLALWFLLSLFYARYDVNARRYIKFTFLRFTFVPIVISLRVLLFFSLLFFLFFSFFPLFSPSPPSVINNREHVDTRRRDSERNERKGKSMLYVDDVYWTRNLQVLSLSRSTRKRR